MLPINLWAVLVSGIVAFVLGFLFHGPILGKLWMKLANITPTGNEKLKDMIPQMLWNLLANVVTALALSVVYLFASTSSYFGLTGVWGGVVIGFLAWLGFLVTTTSIEVIWMGRTVKLWLFEAGCSLIVMLVMGAIIAVW